MSENKIKRELNVATFEFSDGAHIVWRPEGRQWSITRYKNGEMGKSIIWKDSPSVERARYYAHILR